MLLLILPLCGFLRAQRIKRITKFDVLERGHPAMADPTLGTLVGNRFVFVGNAGWDRFGPGGSPDASAPRAVPILATRLTPSARDR